MKPFQIRLSILAAAFLSIGLVTDLLPHPALGPGLIQSCMNAVFTEEIPDAQVANEPQPLKLGRIQHESADQLSQDFQ